MLIVITRSTRVEWKGWTLLDCPRCQRARAFKVGHLLEAWEVHGLRSSESMTGRVASCDFCASSLGLVDSVTEVAHREALALSKEPEGEAALVALLDSGLEQKGAFTTSSGPGIVAGFFLGPLVLLPLLTQLHRRGWLLPTLEDKLILVIGFVGGLLLGTMIGGWLFGRAKAQRNLIAHFAGPLARYEVNRERLLTLAQGAPGYRGLLRALLTSLRTAARSRPGL